MKGKSSWTCSTNSYIQCFLYARSVRNTLHVFAHLIFKEERQLGIDSVYLC